MFGARGRGVPVDQDEPILAGTYCAFHHSPLTFSHTDCN